MVTIMTELNDYKYRGARACVLLHEEHMTTLLASWRRAKTAGITFPASDDPDYQSLETLLFHIFRAARGYMTWMCEKLALPDPEIKAPPALESIEQEADDYLKHLLERWRLPLVEVTEEQCYRPSYQARWGSDYSIDSMLEHAVMHPIRHTFQLEELLRN